MATKSLTFKKIDGITAGSAFTVNAYASDKTVTATVCFAPFDTPVNITKFTPKIGSVKVGGQNWLSTEIIKITYEVGYVESDGTFRSFSSQFPNKTSQVSEKDGTVPTSASMPINSGVLEFAPLSGSYIAYKITIESTQNLVGCKVVMSDFQLSVDYTVQTRTVTWKDWDGTVLKTETVEYGKSATPPSNPTRAYDSTYHYTFSKWDKSYSNITTHTTITAVYTSTAHSYTTETSRTPSTCCTKGSVTKKCSCGKTQTTELALDSSNHAGGTEVKNAKTATCTETGYTGDTHCKGCGAKISSGSTIAALGHSYNTVVTQPTSTSNGYTTHTCSRCGHSYVDTYTCKITVSCDTSMGAVTGGGVYSQNGTATLTATPKTGYRFVKWNDGNTNASRTVVVNNSGTYTAYFELDKINKILADTSQSIGVLLDLAEPPEILADSTKVYG